MNLDNEFERGFFNKASGYFRNSGRTAFKRSVPTFEERVSQNILKFDSVKSKGIRVTAFREGEFQLDNLMRMSTEELMSLIKSDNPSIDLTFQQEYGSFVPDSELVKPSESPLWVVSKLDNGSVRISRIWSN